MPRSGHTEEQIVAVLRQCTTAPPNPNPADTNPTGERTSICDSSGGAAFTHDNMGRIWQDDRNLVGTSTITNALSYTCNFDGSLATMTYPSGRTIGRSRYRLARQRAIARVKHVKSETVAYFRSGRIVSSRCLHTPGEVLSIEFSTQTR